MKQNIFKAVVATIVVLCTLGFVACKDDYSNGPEKSAPVRKDTVYVKSCEVTLNTYNGEGVVTTRTAAVEQEHLDGRHISTSRQKAVFYLGNDSLTEYSYSGRNIIEARGVLKPRYAKTLDSFSDKNVSMKEEVFDNGQIGRFVTFKDGSNHNFYYSFLLTQEYEKSTIQVENPLTGKMETKQLCLNEIVDLEFLSQRVTDLQRDSAKWHAYSLVHSYAGKLSEGPNNGFQYDVHIPLVWVWTGDKDPDFPDDEKDPLIVEDRDSGFDFVNDSTSQSWLSVVTRYTDGTTSKPDTIAVLLKNTIEEPAYQITQVEDLSWTEQELEPFGEVTEGYPYDKENKISVTPFVKTVKAKTTKCDAIYKLRREGRPIYTDSLGGKHYLPEREWTAKDKSWDDEDMTPTENFERKLLTNIITCTFNKHDHDAKGQVELRKVKGEDVKIVKYEYKNFDIRPITPNVQYWTYAEQWAVFSNSKTEKVGEIGTNLYIKTVVNPKTQEVDVNDWNISDLKIQKYNATRQKSRPDTISTGIFTITPFAKKNTTRTNKSEHNFTTTYDGTVVFKDKFGQEVSFKALDPSFEDKGGVKTLTDLLEENDHERKLMTSTLAVTAFGSDVSDNVAEVIFRKKVEKEELISWDKEQSLTPAGNGLWTSTTTIIYNYKLAGQKKSSPIVLTLDWSIVGEAKSQVILAKAEAPFASLDEGTWSGATPSYPQAGVTVYTSKKTVSENYTNLTDKYTATMQTAKYSATVEGKKIEFDFLAPSSMSVAHKTSSLVDGKRTTQQNGSTYDVWDHTGSVTATVTSTKGNQSQTATDEKEVLVKKDVRPSTDYDVDDLERYFVISKVKNNAGWADAIMFLTKTHVFTVVNSYNKDGNFAGRTTDMVERSRVVVSGQVNSIVYDSQTGHYLPALTASDHDGWSTEGFIDGRAVVCDRSNQQAIDEGIKNFVGSSTSVPTPFITQVTASPTKWHEKNFVTVTWKTSTTTGSVSVGSN